MNAKMTAIMAHVYECILISVKFRRFKGLPSKKKLLETVGAIYRNKLLPVRREAIGFIIEKILAEGKEKVKDILICAFRLLTD